MDARIRESDSWFRSFIERAPLAIAVFDREMRYVAASRRWITDYRLPDQNLVGRSHYELFPQLPTRWREAHQRGLQGEVVHCAEDSFEWPDGTVQWLRWEIQPRCDAADEGGIIIFVEDITERKLAEHGIQQLQSALEGELLRRTAELRKSAGKAEGTPPKSQGLQGILHVCAHCKRVRDTGNIWKRMESFIHEYTEAKVSHGFCPDCQKKYFGYLWAGDDGEP